jgi:hypothetical protein
MLGMLQINYLHNDVIFDGPYHRNAMADRQSLSPIPHNDPVDGPSAMTSPVWDELDLAESLLETAQIFLLFHKIHKRVSRSKIDCGCYLPSMD